MRTRYLLLILGAAIAPLVYLALRRSFNQPTALLAAYICAFSHSLIVLGSGVHSEIPYLFLFVLSLHDWDQMRYGNRTAATLRWSLLQALACLFRADHVLTIALQLGWLIWQRGKGSIRTALIALATICLSLAPGSGTHISKFKAITANQYPHCQRKACCRLMKTRLPNCAHGPRLLRAATPHSSVQR